MATYKKLINQPLKFVLAEFRFSQVLKIGDYIPELQDALRKEYPILDNRKEQAVKVQGGNFEVLQADRWAFVSADRRNSIDISSDRIMFSTSDYPRFEGFAERCRVAIDILIQKVKPQLLTRIGLRYGDLVQLEKSESFEQIVDEHFLFPQALSSLGETNTQRCEVVLRTKSGVLLVRTLYGTHNLTCLPDVQGLPIALDQEPKLSVSERMILDFDHFWEAKGESVRFELDEILTILNSLHETSREAFWKITTDYARNEKWD